MPHSEFCDCRDCPGLDRDKRPGLTWRCDSCGSEFDSFTYGGPCVEDGCAGELQRRRVSREDRA